MINFFKNLNAEKAILVLLLIGYVLFQLPFMHLDLWNDEIYTLKYFTFVSPLQTITDYQAPNNHILFNLVNNFYLRVIGERSIYALMEHPWVVRVISLFYSFGTIFFTFKCAEKISGGATAVLSVIFLCSTVPYYNYAVEIRGYSLSIFLITAISYYLFCYWETPGRSLLYRIIFLAAAAVYAIPLNLYPIAGMCFFLCVMLIVSFVFRNRNDANSNSFFNRKKNSVMIVALTGGVLVALLLYAGIFRQVFFNEFVVSDDEFSSAKWFALTKEVFVSFFSFRYWILPLMFIGLCSQVYQFVKKKSKKEFVFFFFLLVMLMFPFLISFMRKDASPDRTFVNLIPFFVLLLAWVINGVVILFPGKKIRSLLLIFVAGYCFVNLSQQLNKVSDHLLNDILTSGRSHNLYYNYYLAHFRPLNVVKKFKESVYHDGDFVVIRDAEPHDLPEYLTKYNIPVHDFSLTDSVLRSGKKVFLFSRYPNEIVNDSFGKQHQCNVKLISEGLTYHNLFELERKAGTEANQ